MAGDTRQKVLKICEIARINSERSMLLIAEVDATLLGHDGEALKTKMLKRLAENAEQLAGLEAKLSGSNQQ